MNKTLTKFELKELTEKAIVDAEVAVPLKYYLKHSTTFTLGKYGRVQVNLPMDILIDAHTTTLSNYLIKLADNIGTKGYVWREDGRAFYPSFLKKALRKWLIGSVKRGRALDVYDLKGGE